MGARVARDGLLTPVEVAECFGRTQFDSLARYIRRCNGSLFPAVARFNGDTRRWLRSDSDAWHLKRDGRR